jgi:hypothetical protein
VTPQEKREKTRASESQPPSQIGGRVDKEEPMMKNYDDYYDSDGSAIEDGLSPINLP